MALVTPKKFIIISLGVFDNEDDDGRRSGTGVCEDCHESLSIVGRVYSSVVAGTHRDDCWLTWYSTVVG